MLEIDVRSEIENDKCDLGDLNNEVMHMQARQMSLPVVT